MNRLHAFAGGRVAFALAITLGSAAALVYAPADAATTPEAKARAEERAGIANERAAANAQFLARERVCQAQFVVATCMTDASKERRATLARLHQRELSLSDAQRRDAAALREQELAEKASRQQARPSEPAADEPAEGKRRTPAPNPVAPLRGKLGSPGGAAAGSSAAERRAEEQRNEAAFEAKARAVQEHRDAVEKRNAERAAKGKAALPLPSAASAP
jgi:colicin import membrane protein